jgi:DNA repair exonuclease SbcCD ATPase subunit
MLILEDVNPTGFFSYGMHETVPLDNQGVVLLTGINRDRLSVTANASGKSSLLNTIAHILYGENPTEKGEDKIVNSVWNRGCWGMVKFNISGQRYRIILTRSWKGKYPDASVEDEPCQVHAESGRYEGTNLYFDVGDDKRWRDLRKTRVSETRAEIVSILGISYERFLATSYLAQQKGLAFIGGKNKDRMELITELTDMKIWDQCVISARTKSAITETQIDISKRDIIAMTTKADTLATTTLKDVEEAQRECARLESDSRDIEASIIRKTDELGVVQQQRVDLRKDIQEAEVFTKDLKAEIDDISRQITNEVVNLTKLNERRKQPIKNPNIDNGLTAKASAIINQTWAIDNQLNGMLSGSGKCNKCGSIVSDAALAAEKEELNAKREDLRTRLLQLEAEMGEIQTAAENEKNARIDSMIKTATDTHTNLTNRITTANEVMDLATKNALLIRTSDVELSTRSTTIQIDLVGAKAKLDANTIAINNITAAIRQDAEVKNRIANIRDDAAKAQHVLDLLMESLRYYEAIIKGMGDKGVKAHKFGAMIQTLNELVADNIRILTDGQVQVWFSPWREKSNAKSGDDIVPEIQIFVKEGPKEQVELALYSGMERQQIVIAIIRAFNKLAMLQGAGTNVLFMDEMFGMFDEASAATTIKLMNQLKNSDWGTIVVVTHNPEIKQVLDYDQLWTAEKQNHITTLKREKHNGRAAS